jgi:uncharacterized membrane protein YkvI
MDYMIIFFLFGALTIMGAGAGAIVNQHFNISGMWGSMFMIVITALTVMSGLGGVINSISFLVPFLVTTVIAVSISSIVVNFNYASASLTSILPNALTQNWLWSTILYVSYNILLSLAVLGPLGYAANDEKTIRKGSIIGGTVLGAAGISIYFALLKNADYIINKEVPMTYIAGQISEFAQIIYIIILIIAIYTTAVGSLYGFAARLEISKKINLKTLIIFTSILAFICTQFGFSNLIKYLYPLVGYGGIVFLVGMLMQPFRGILTLGSTK